MGSATANSGFGVGLGATAAAKLGFFVSADPGSDGVALSYTSKAAAPAAASTPPVTAAAVTSAFLLVLACRAPLAF